MKYSELNAMSTEDLRALNSTVVSILKHRVAQAVMTFNIGDRVSFVGRRGIRHEGVVIGVNRKTVSVRVGMTPWRVSPGLLKKASEKSNGLPEKVPA